MIQRFEIFTVGFLTPGSRLFIIPHTKEKMVCPKAVRVMKQMIKCLSQKVILCINMEISFYSTLFVASFNVQEIT